MKDEILLKAKKNHLYFHRHLSFDNQALLKFRYSEKATKIWPIFFFGIMYLVALNYNWKMGQTFVAFSEYLNFMKFRQILFATTTYRKNEDEHQIFTFLMPFLFSK